MPTLRDDYCQLIGLLIMHRDAIEPMTDSSESLLDVLYAVRKMRDAIPLDDGAMKPFKNGRDS